MLYINLLNKDAQGDINKLVTPHEIYNQLGLNNAERQESYAALFDIGLDINDVKIIRHAVQFSMPTGNTQFKQQIEQAFKRKIGEANRGRPRKMVTQRLWTKSP